MLVYIPYMDPMGKYSNRKFRSFRKWDLMGSSWGIHRISSGFFLEMVMWIQWDPWFFFEFQADLDGKPVM